MVNYECGHICNTTTRQCIKNAGCMCVSVGGVGVSSMKKPQDMFYEWVWIYEWMKSQLIYLLLFNNNNMFYEPK